VSPAWITLGMQIVIAFILGFTVRLMFLNNRNANRTMGMITDTLTMQAQTQNEMIRRLYALEQRVREMEDGAKAVNRTIQ